jgi:guanylate kinase
MSRLIVLAGPSCVGKSPLLKALRRQLPNTLRAAQTLVLYNSRAPRPGETDGEDYHFRSADEIQQLAEQDRYVVMKVRGDTQAVDLVELRENLQRGDVIYEGNPFVGEILVGLDLPDEAELISAFISPLSADELRERMTPERPGDVDAFVTDVMRRKLLRRTRKHKSELSLPDLEEIERRCGSAPVELRKAHRFGCVIVNHDGEDSEHWNAFTWPIGDARKTLHAVGQLLTGEPVAGAETWDPDLLGQA